MREFPFPEMATAVVAHIKIDVLDEFPETKLVKHDDHWMREVNLEKIANRSPVFYVSMSGLESESGGDTDDDPMNCDPLIDIFWLASANLVGKFRGDASAVIGWLYRKFSQGEYKLPGFSEVGTVIKRCSPIRGNNYNDLLEYGIVGARVSLEIESAHFDTDTI